MNVTAQLKQCAYEARSWLFDKAAPLWARPSLLQDGLFAESLSLEGQASFVQRRTRVQARQIFAYCELGRLGWKGEWRDAAGDAVDALLARGKRPDGFFVHRFGPDGCPSDPRADLYDSAFIIFAFGHAALMLDRLDLLNESQDLMEKIEHEWANPHGGFNEGEIDGPPRRQNPHMHLLEASIVQWRATSHHSWAERVKLLSDLGRERFIDPDTGALTEFFASDWSRSSSDEGQTVEPGHCFEWSWLFEIISEYGLGDSLPSDKLAEFARTYGLAQGRSHAINSVRLDGKIIDANARLWPQTERLKSALARWRRTRDDAEVLEAIAAYRGLVRYFGTPIQGMWRDKIAADGRWVDENSPASSFYHIVCALSELLTTADMI